MAPSRSTRPNLPFSGFHSMTDLGATALATQRVQVALLTVMASLALLLSALGIFALVADTVGQRTREIGIRLALGSTVREAMLQASRSGVGASALGLVLGLILGAHAARGTDRPGQDTARTVAARVRPVSPPTLLRRTPCGDALLRHPGGKPGQIRRDPT